MEGLKLGGVTIVRSALLPKGTMWVSEDVYEMLTQTPEEAQKKHAEQLAYIRHTADEIDRLTRKARGES